MSSYAFLKNKYIEIITYFNGRRFFLAGMKVQLDKDGRRILLGDDTGGEAVMQWPFRLQIGAVRIPADSLACTCTYM
jgi:hypothetical protein